jgi:hypothetical protein
MIRSVCIGPRNEHIHSHKLTSKKKKKKKVFLADQTQPCGTTQKVFTAADTFNVASGGAFPLTWSLWVNHNNPPLPAGSVDFFYLPSVNNGTGSPVSLGQSVSITTQAVNTYHSAKLRVPVGARLGSIAAIQAVYSVNGAPSPFPKYYSCVTFTVGQ